MNISVLNKITGFIGVNRIHFLVWFLYIFYETIIVGLTFGSFGRPGNYIVHYFFNILLFYVHALVVLPAAFKNPKSRFWKIPVLIVLELAVFVLILLIVDSLLIRYTDFIQFTLNTQFYYRIAYRGSFFVGIGTGYYYLRTFLKQKEITEESERKHLSSIIAHQETQNELNITVNAYLKAQINPHFLFNTLNFIYNNARKTAPAAAEAIMTLSDMMRYAIKAQDAGDFIYLLSEAEQVDNLIRLHQLRQNDQLYIKFDYSECGGEIKFIPLILMTLVENIFKHGNLSKESKPAEIMIRSDDHVLEIHTANMINENHCSTSDGIGLANISKRLKITYGNRVKFDHIVEDNLFKIRILLQNEKSV